MADSASSETPNPQPVVPAISPTPHNSVTLQVGERRFTTMSTTLTVESAFFSRLLSDQWKKVQPDGSYFVDADGELFEDILRYLRRGVLPLYYSPGRGHDYPRYLALMEEAEYFQIDRLVKWLKEQSYLEVVHTHYSLEVMKESEGLDKFVNSNVEVEYHPAWETEKIYICPRGISSHRGESWRCGRLCKNARGDAEEEYKDERVLKVGVVQRKTEFRQHLCLIGR